MLVHGYTPDDLLHASIVSIPKDKCGNLNASNNYRGIALCNALSQVRDLWLLCMLKKTVTDARITICF